MNAALQDALLEILVVRMDGAPTGASLVDWATRALAEGLDSESLVYLAGLPGDCSVFDAGPLLDRSLAELGQVVPPAAELRRAYVGAVSRALLGGTIDVESALDRIDRARCRHSIIQPTWHPGASPGRASMPTTTTPSRRARSRPWHAGSPASGPGIFSEAPEVTVYCNSLRLRQKHQRTGGEPNGRSRLDGNVIAALASFFIPGLGQLIQGRLGMAIVQFCLAAALWVVLMGWIIHLWSILDAAMWKPKSQAV